MLACRHILEKTRQPTYEEDVASARKRTFVEVVRRMVNTAPERSSREIVAKE